MRAGPAEPGTEAKGETGISVRKTGFCSIRKGLINEVPFAGVTERVEAPVCERNAGWKVSAFCLFNYGCQRRHFRLCRL